MNILDSDTHLEQVHGVQINLGQNGSIYAQDSFCRCGADAQIHKLTNLVMLML